MSPGSAPRIFLSSLAAAACAATCFILKDPDGHLYFHWIWLAWTAFFASAAFLLRGRIEPSTRRRFDTSKPTPFGRFGRLRLAAAGLFGLSAALLAFELFLGGHAAALGLAPALLWGTETTSPHSLRTGPPLGYRPAPDNKISSRKTVGGEVVYDAIYSIDENGFRRTPPLPPGSPAVVFLGDSLTFGEGVNDDEAFPAVFQAQTGLKAVNLSYRGYGPHHLLRLLETGLDLPATARYRPRQAIYLFSSDHVPRVAGCSWDPEGPRYELDALGRARCQGPFHGRRTARVIGLLTKSAVLRWGWSHWNHLDFRGPERDIELFAAIVAEMQSAYQERYPGGFQAFFWGFGDKNTARIIEALSRRGVPVILLEDEVPETLRKDLYFPRDSHPKAALHRALGLYWARWAAARLPARAGQGKQ